jgi:hypothetical protein
MSDSISANQVVGRSSRPRTTIFLRVIQLFDGLFRSIDLPFFTKYTEFS